MAEIEYDKQLSIVLDTVALPQLRSCAQSFQCATPAQHRTALRFVTLHGLAYDWNPDTGEFTIYPPD